MIIKSITLHHFFKELALYSASHQKICINIKKYLNISSIFRSPNIYVGGARRDRTADPLLAKQVLSQLSYGPSKLLVGLGGVEPPTSPLSGVRSNQLSYRPIILKGTLGASEVTTTGDNALLDIVRQYV